MANKYTPPKNGSLCWVKIPATEVARAKEFYSQVFGWSFKPGSDEYPEDRIAMFEFPDPRVGAAMVEGGITKQEDTKRTSGGVVNYLYVDSIEETAGKVQAAGGKMVGEKVKEGSTGWMQLFQDTEENTSGVWTLQKASDK